MLSAAFLSMRKDNTMNRKWKIRFQKPIFSGEQTWFHDCHANTQVLMPSGTRLVAFWAGTCEGTPDQAIWLSRCVKGEWQDPVRIKHIYQLPHWNPVIMRHGSRVYLYYKVGLTVQTWYTLVSYSDDEGLTWSESVEAVPGDYTPRASVRNKILQASNGWWIAPTSSEVGTAMDSYADISKDEGRTWEVHGIPMRHIAPASLSVDRLWEGLKKGSLWENDLSVVGAWDGTIQPSMWESAPGHIHAMMRSTRGRIYRSDSDDYGQTWCEAYPTVLPNNCCGIDAARMDSGLLAVVYNPIGDNWGRRSPLSVAFSEDNGVTFTELLHLETRDGEYSYPSVVAEGDTLHILYTSNRRTFVECVLE